MNSLSAMSMMAALAIPSPVNESHHEPERRTVSSMPIIEDTEDVTAKTQPAIDCSVPLPSPNSEVIRLGARDAATISNLALGGQNEPAFVAIVDVEEGDRPLYIIASDASPTIWQFTGNTNRIKTLILSSRTKIPDTDKPATASLGIKRNRVHFVHNDCFGDFAENMRGIYFESSGNGPRVIARIGRPADKHYAAYRFNGLRVPSLNTFLVNPTVPRDFPVPSTSSSARFWYEFLYHFKGGIADISPGQIVAPQRVDRFITYPYKAGLAQLLEQKGLRYYANSAYPRIIKRLHLPPGLCGGNSETFEIEKGVPLPTGGCHSKIL